MNYIGSKLSVINFLKDSINKLLYQADDHRPYSDLTFADLFAGTGIVGSEFKKIGCRIISNDIQYYSYILNKYLIESNNNLYFKNLIPLISELKNQKNQTSADYVLNYLQNLKGKKGFIYSNYCPGGTADKDHIRNYFSDENGQKTDAIRQKIKEWHQKKLINNNEYFFLLASLIDSIDRYANTASVYGAFLKKIKISARRPIQLQPYGSIIKNNKKNKVYNEDINLLIRKIKGDILYLDPPYNHRQYASNYHLLETIARYDSPSISGKTGLRDYKKQKSLYCNKNDSIKAFSDLIENADFKYIALSYNDEGIIPIPEIEKILSSKGKYVRFETKYKRFKADRDENRNHKKKSTIEYLHCVISK